MQTPRLSIALPCLNEQENIRATVEGLDRWMKSRNIEGEIIAVNDGSSDRTGEILSELETVMPNVRVVTHPHNRGYGAAVLSGLDAARGEVIGYMDSDGQFDPEDFDVLLPLMNQYSFVTGRRKHRADPFVRKMNAKLFGLLSFFILGIWVRDINCAMKLMRREIWSKIRPHVATGALVNAEMFYRLKLNTIPWAQRDVRHFPRKFGTQTGAKLSVILRMFKELLRLRTAGKKFEIAVNSPLEAH